MTDTLPATVAKRPPDVDIEAEAEVEALVAFEAAAPDVPPRSGPTLQSLLVGLGRINRPALPKVRVPRLRLLPTVMFVAVLIIGVRVGDLSELSGNRAILTIGSQSQAEATPPATETEPETETHAGAAADGQGDGVAAPPTTEDPTGAGGRAPLGDGFFHPDEVSSSERELLRGLAERREELEARERALAQREALLTVAESRMQDKVGELQTVRTQIEDMLMALDEQSEAQLMSLVQIYEAMRPSDAAVIFNGLEMDVLISVLERMREQKSAPILAGMNPDQARQVTTELASRRQLPTLPQ
ncbi:MAG: MotE family protein [Inquilinaceae bacterium]